MYTIMGITGQVGGAAARALLEAGQQVRGIVRDKAKATSWAASGVDLVAAEFKDGAALEAAFLGADGVFVMIPPYFTPSEGYPEAHAVLSALHQALALTRPAKIVALSSVGAHQPHGLGIITQPRLVEETLGTLPLPTAFIRASWFMENSKWDLNTVREKGEMLSYLQPLDRAIPMVASRDIGCVIAQTLSQNWTGRRLIELEGPDRYSPNDIAALLAKVLGRSVRATAIPREEWEASFEAQGAAPGASQGRIEMLDGFNSGWIDFQGAGCEHRIGQVSMESVLAGLAR